MIGMRARTQSPRQHGVVYHNSEVDRFPDYMASQQAAATNGKAVKGSHEDRGSEHEAAQQIERELQALGKNVDVSTP